MVSFHLHDHNVSMYTRLNRGHRALAVMLGLVTLADVAVLFAWDAFPRLFPVSSHDYLASFSLGLIAVAYLVYQIAHRPPWRELLKAFLLAIAFLFWAANQLWPASPRATLYNDIAIALFVLDVFLVMAGWPSSSADESFGETGAGPSERVRP